MIELKNITKTYKPKKGQVVSALTNINLKIGETGLVFILGKSGSGKSTFLNVVGGLDKADIGDLIIQIKNTKDFKFSDLDSYRNTLVGFIFQEYNILEDMTIAQNIGIALELQGIKANNDRINKVLKDVDLEGYATRKPNELSGGQKQRVAIARALVKDPKIIMADEPTGALDSETGKQVFETLKKLSKERLVLIVSHDRDFANTYGDRVIEFSDGSIVSDITKKYDYNATKSNIIKDNNVISINKGYALDIEDVKELNRFLEDKENKLPNVEELSE